MKIVVAQFYTDNVSFGKYSRDINQRYCEQKGYTYHLSTDNDKIVKGTEDRARKWYKVKLIQEAFQVYDADYVLYLDADAMIADHSIRIEDFISDDHDIVFAEDHINIFKFNTSVVLAKKSALTNKFLNSWWLMGNLENGKYKFLTPQDKICANKVYTNLSSQQSRIKIISNRQFNWHTATDKCFIFHGCGYEYLKNRKLDEVYLKLSEESDRTLEIDSLELLGETYLGKESPEVLHLKTVYTELFEKFKKTTNNIILINPTVNSIYIWRSYFPNAQLYIIGDDVTVTKDITNVQYVEADVTKKSDIEIISNLVTNAEIILDCSYRGIIEQHLLFGHIFEKLNDGGVYAIEGLQTSIRPPSPAVDSSVWSTNSDNLIKVIYYTTIEMLKSISTGTITSDFMTATQKYYILENVNSFELSQANPSNLVGIVTKKIAE